MAAAYPGLMLALVFGPMAAAAVLPWLDRHAPRARDAWTVAVTAATLAGVVALLPAAGVAPAPAAALPLLLGNLRFAADAFGLLFALFSALVWFCATLYARSYFRGETGTTRFHAASLVALGAQLGVALAADLVTLYVCFELLGLVALLFVVHRGTPEARRAATQYFWLTALGGMLLLGGVLLVVATGGGDLASGASAGGALPAVAAGLMVLGFGVKAGMVPVHLWLPSAHPIAPAPASALLSGVMIKAGACGIFRTLYMVFRPAPEAVGAASFSAQLGLAVLWLGIITMAVGVVMALGQRDAKRMLAYHSISQMGFILAGLGAGAFLGGEAAIGAAGGLMHAFNHALFKSCLFLGIGAVAWRAGTRDMYALGGLWRRMPVTFALMLVAAAGISGVPLFNGFISKCLVHHALTAAEADSGMFSLRIAGWVYVLVCAGTAASFIKLIGLVFLRRPQDDAVRRVREAPVPMLLAMALLCAPIVWLGLDPAPVLGGLVVPGLANLGLAVGALEHHVEHGFLQAGDMLLAGGTVGLGAAICLLGLRFGWFHCRPPAWFGLSWWLQRSGLGVLTAAPAGPDLLAGLERFASLYGHLAQRAAWMLRGSWRRLSRGLRGLERGRRRLAQRWFAGAAGSVEQAFLEAVWLDLEQERQDTLRAARDAIATDCATRAAGLPRHEREAQLAAGREVTRAMTTTLFEERLAALAAVGREEGAAQLRARYERLHRVLPAARHAVVEAAPRLASARRRGGSVARLLHAALDPVIRRERALLGQAGAVSGPAPTPASAGARGGLGRWLLALIRLGAAELRQHQSAWPKAEGLDSDPAVVLGRWQLQRYARDMGLNVALAAALLVILTAVLWLAGAA